MIQSQADKPLQPVITVLRSQRRAETVFSIAILGLGLFMLVMAYGGWFHTERNFAAAFMAIFALFSGLALSAAGIYGLVRPKESLEADPLYTVAYHNPETVYAMVLTTTSDSEAKWYLHIFSSGSERPLRTLEYMHANDARRAVAALQQVFPQATFSEQIRD